MRGMQDGTMAELLHLRQLFTGVVRAYETAFRVAWTVWGGAQLACYTWIYLTDMPLSLVGAGAIAGGVAIGAVPVSWTVWRAIRPMTPPELDGLAMARARPGDAAAIIETALARIARIDQEIIYREQAR